METVPLSLWGSLTHPPSPPPPLLGLLPFSPSLAPAAGPCVGRRVVQAAVDANEIPQRTSVRASPTRPDTKSPSSTGLPSMCSDE